ncbi:MAG: isochorismatase family protein [Chloroflexi bacterium]|nr:isochorismatase family protein [Chloroflexota bacterium]
MSRVWEPFLSDRDRAVFEGAGYGVRQGFGQRPALLIVDVNYNFVGDRREPVEESIKRFRNSCGYEGWAAVDAIRDLLAAARDKGIPVVYSTGVNRSDGRHRGAWDYKNSRNGEDVQGAAAEIGQHIVREIAPWPREFVIEKLKPSMFFGTPLVGHLLEWKVDQLLVVGGTTSGCVRATAVDGFSHNFRVALVEEGCFDRGQASHALSLWDLQAKYADVVPVAETISYIEGLPAGLFHESGWDSAT